MFQGGFTYGPHTGKLFCLPCAHFSLEENLNLDFSSITSPLSLLIFCLEYSSPSSNWLLSLLSPLPSLPAVKALTIWVTEPVWGFCLMFRVSIQTLHPGIGEVTGSGLHWSDYEQDSSQSSIYHPAWRCPGPPGVNVSSALMSQIS